MPITDELSTMIDPDILPGVQNNVTAESPLAGTLLRFTHFKRGPARDGIRITQLIDQNNTRFYRDYDAATREATDKHVAHFEAWSNLQGDRILAGTRLEEVIGKTSKQVMRADSLRSLDAWLRDAIIDIVGAESDGAVAAMSNTYSRTLTGNTLPSDNIDRMPITLDDVFDETSGLHGLGITGLGTWPTGHPWQRNPVNTDGSTNIHIPQIFHNSGTPRTISKSVLSGPIIQMMAQVRGFWLCGLDPSLYETLSSEFDAQFDFVMGIGLMEWTVRAVRIQNVYFFPDADATTTSARCIHIGNPQNGQDGSFYPLMWIPDEVANIGPVQAGAFAAGGNRIPTVRLGRPFQLPIYAQEWTRDGTSADAISSSLQIKYCFLCVQRWKQFEIRDLQA